MIKEIRAFLLVFSFFSRFPIKAPEDFEKILPRSIKYIPLFALISGTFLFLLMKIFSFFLKDEITAIIVFIIQYLIFNYFHFDGFLDTSDAFLSGKTKKEEILSIMEDTHVGAFAVLLGSTYIATKLYIYTIFLIPNNPELIIFSFSAGRIFIVLFSYVFGSSAKDYGLGYIFVSNAKKGFISSSIAFLIISAIYFYETIITFFICLIFCIYFVRKVGGLTGDILGWICEFSEIVWLLVSWQMS